MSTEAKIKKPKAIPSPLNKLAYGAFTLLGIFLYIYNGSVSDGLMYMALALVFDPFDQSVRWNNRPFYQKAWLIAHLVIILAMFVLMIILPVTK